jgi:hypothetical protein
MKEADWLSCTDPQRMRAYLAGIASDRKLRLFDCACCRRLWEALSPLARRAIEVAEDFADGVADVAILRAAHKALSGDLGAVNYSLGFGNAVSAAFGAARPPDKGYYPGWVFPMAAEAARYEGFHKAVASGRRSLPPGLKEAEEVAQAALLRELFGNPFRPVTVAPAVLCWNDGTVVRLARAISEERAWDRMPVLADALEDAGCDGEDLLAHCRGGEHARGCFVVDAILGNQDDFGIEIS